MSEFFTEVIYIILGIVFSGMAGAIAIFGKWLWSINKNVTTMVHHGELRRTENRVQFQMLRAQSKAARTILEVVANNQNNGNVEKAFEHLACSDKAYDEFADGMLG
jgi:hypothetical protein